VSKTRLSENLESRNIRGKDTRQVFSEKPGDTTTASVKKIGEARKVPLESALHPNPFRGLAEAALDPRILGTPDGQNERIPPKLWKESCELNAACRP